MSSKQDYMSLKVGQIEQCVMDQNKVKWADMSFYHFAMSP